MKKKNVTIVIGEDLYRRARIWAAQQNASLSEVVRTILETVPDMPRAQRLFANRVSTPGTAPPSSRPSPPTPSSPHDRPVGQSLTGN